MRFEPRATLDVILLIDVAHSGKINAGRRPSSLSADPRIARRRRRGTLSGKDEAKPFLDHRRQSAIVGRRLLARTTKEIVG
ncbi:hypothetical protein [Methylocystis sp.]|uniref:hypothetical protein n=1 Tax=Methylocystis sp. TaxID=1911079 RepID=UPI003DA26DD7